MFDTSNYGCKVIVMCDVHLDNIVSTYAGFSVVKIEDNKEITRFYEGDPIEDYETAISYSHSISNRVSKSPIIKKFWDKLGMTPKEVKR